MQEEIIMLKDKDQRMRLIIGVVIILMGVMALVNNLLAENVTSWLWIATLAVSAVIFGWGYTFARETWVAIGAYVFAAIAVVVLVTTQIKPPDNWVPVIVLSAIGLPFVVAWWADRKQWGLLIPAYVMFAIIPILLLSDNTAADEQIIPGYSMLAIGLPFIVGFLASRNVWLLVPGGIMVLIGLAFLGVGAGLAEQLVTIVVPIVVIVIGVILLLMSRSGQSQKRT
jgi:hypothetical protein